jgi:hypothetical protein
LIYAKIVSKLGDLTVTNLLTFGEIAPDAPAGPPGRSNQWGAQSATNEKLSNKLAHLRRDSA